MGKNHNPWRPNREQGLALFAQGVNHELGETFGIAPEKITVHSAINESSRGPRGYSGWLKISIEWVEGDTWHLHNVYLSDKNEDWLPTTRTAVGAFAVQIEGKHSDYTRLNGILIAREDPDIIPSVIEPVCIATSEAPTLPHADSLPPELVAA
jgi:hypothetical protein